VTLRYEDHSLESKLSEGVDCAVEAARRCDVDKVVQDVRWALAHRCLHDGVLGTPTESTHVNIQRIVSPHTTPVRVSRKMK
jgi:hypothetical protein